ncbi:hypothetical protein VCHC17A1_4013B, partial [Vibrio cholerae HC-17A1]
ELLT